MRWRDMTSGWQVAAIAVLLAAMPLSAAGSVPTAPQFVYRKRYAMGTVFEIVAYSPSVERASRAAGAALSAVCALDRMMTNFDPQSDLSLLDRRGRFRSVAVPPDLYRIIRASLVYSRLSKGKYDVTIGPLAAAWKSAMRGRGQRPSATRIAELKGCVGYRKVQLIPPDHIELHSSCMSLDLGSIGKGYAVDRAVAILRSYGIRNALINAGGSTIYGLGSPPGRAGWKVGLRDPSGRIRPEVLLHNNSVSTSEQAVSSLIDAGQFGHIIDPATGRPLPRNFAVSAVAPTATASDGLSTTLFLVGPKAGSRVVRGLADTAAIWISPNGRSEMCSTGPRIVFDGQAGKIPVRQSLR